MNIVRFDDRAYMPANHEDPKNPGVLKKVLYKHNDFIKGRIQMVNWALLPVGNSFTKHYHEDMEELFVILNGDVEIIVDTQKETLHKGDSVLVPVGKVHQMINACTEDVNYLVVGISLGKNGKTVVI